MSANRPFFNLSTDADNFIIDTARVGNLLVQGLDGNNEKFTKKPGFSPLARESYKNDVDFSRF